MLGGINDDKRDRMIAKRTNRLLSILLFNLMLGFIGILILELVFGNWFNQANLNKLNLIRDRTITFKIGNLYQSDFRTVTYTRDKFGLRGQFKNPSDITILSIGGSTTDQRYITDGQTWQDVLQQQFEAMGRNIVVANAGVDGQSTFGHIKNFDWWFPTIPNLKSKYILFYVGLNDFYKNVGNGKEALTEDEKSYWVQLREKSAIYQMLRTYYGVYQAELGHHIGHRLIDFKNEIWISRPLQVSYDKLMDERLKEYAERLEVLIQRTKEIGSTPIFVTQPSHMYRLSKGAIEGIKKSSSYDGVPINGMDFYYMMRKLDDVTCSEARKHCILCLDLSKEMLQEWEDNDFYDFAHMTPKGSRKIGQYLFIKLRCLL